MTGKTLLPGSVIGIVGGGQLGRMLAQAAARLGLRASIFSPDPESPAFDVAAFRHCAAYDDLNALDRFADQADVVTFEFENVPADALAHIEQRRHLAPSRRALEVSQDRLEERRFLGSLGLPCAPHEAVHGGAELEVAWQRLTGGREDAVTFLKRARFGYDGKGQMTLTGRGEIETAADWLGDHHALLESAVNFRFELSALCVRGRNGRTVFYDPPENVHRGGILRESLIPAPLPDNLKAAAFGHAAAIAESLGYVGVLAVEMFLTTGNDGPALLINEIAPRVHNSGHWTQDACAIGQFENHIRAVAGWPLGSPERHSDARMVNLLGDEANRWQALLAENPARSLTLYGKEEAKPDRKMGHYVELKPRS